MGYKNISPGDTRTFERNDKEEELVTRVSTCAEQCIECVLGIPRFVRMERNIEIN
jgi:hypothetical protein